MTARMLRLGILVAAVAGASGAAAQDGAGAQDGARETPSIEQELAALERELAAAETDAGAQEDAGGTGTEAGSGTGASGTQASGTHGHGTRAPGTAKPEPASTEAEGESAISPSAWRLYRDPILCGGIAGLVLGLLGVYVVARRIVFVSAALSEVAALGITLGFLATGYLAAAAPLRGTLPPLLAIVACVAAVSVLSRAGDRPSFPRDAVLGVAFVVPAAFVLVIGPYIPQEMHEIEAVLHGSAVVVRPGDLYAVAFAGAAVIATQLAGFRGFVFATLDPTVAKTQGVPVRKLDAVLFGSIALMTGLVTRALGALPTFALTVLPAIGAIGLRVGLGPVFAIAATAGAISGAGGYLVALWLDASVGASQTLAAALACALLRVGARLTRGRPA